MLAAAPTTHRRAMTSRQPRCGHRHGTRSASWPSGWFDAIDRHPWGGHPARPASPFGSPVMQIFERAASSSRRRRTRASAVSECASSESWKTCSAWPGSMPPGSQPHPREDGPVGLLRDRPRQVDFSTIPRVPVLIRWRRSGRARRREQFLAGTTHSWTVTACEPDPFREIDVGGGRWSACETVRLFSP